MNVQFTPKIISIIKSGYTLPLFRGDFFAGLTVAIVALPLAMAFAIASGTSPDKGLITAVVAGFLISFLGGSRVQIGGPTGAFVVVVFNVIAHHGYDGLILATLMAGAILLVAGYARLGQIIRFIPHPVITGFTAGIAVIIASSQVKDFFGLKIDKVPADFFPKWAAYFSHWQTLQPATFMLGAAALVLILLIRRFAPRLPAYLIAVIAATLAAALLHLPVETIGMRFPHLPTGLPSPAMPVWSFSKIQEVAPSAFTIAFLAGIEALLSALVADGMTGFQHRSNQELVGQGFANIASALFGGLPATGAIARTATNVKAGGRTPVAGMLHAVFLLVFMMCAMPAIAYVPLVALAAILFVVAWGMSEISHFIHILKLPTADRWVLLLTFGLTVMVDLTVAIGVGVTLASLLFMNQMSQSVEISPSTDEEEGEGRRKNLPKDVEIFTINGPLFFGVAGDLLQTLGKMGQTPRVLILEMQSMPYLNSTGLGALEKLFALCKGRNTRVILSGLQAQPKKLLGVLNGVQYAADAQEALRLSLS